MKKSDIIADALGTLDDRTLDVHEAPEKATNRSVLPQIIAITAFMLLFAVSLPFLRALFAKTPDGPVPANAGTTVAQTETAAETEEVIDNSKDSKRTFTDEDQPASEPGWDFNADKVIDCDAAVYMPSLQSDKYEILGHNCVVCPASMLGDYTQRLDNWGFDHFDLDSYKIYYRKDVMVFIRKTFYIYDTHKQTDVFCARVFVNSPTKGGLTQEEALNLINKKYRIEVNAYTKLNGTGFTLSDMGAAFCAIDVTPSGFYALTGMQIFVAPLITKPDLPADVDINPPEWPFAAAFFVNRNGAVLTDLGWEPEVPLYVTSAFYDIDKYLSKDGRFGAPVLCDTDGDGVRELLLLTPYNVTDGDRIVNRVRLTVYGTETPEIIARTDALTFKDGDRRLLCTESGAAVLRIRSGDGKDEYYEISLENGGIYFYGDTYFKTGSD